VDEFRSERLEQSPQVPQAERIESPCLAENVNRAAAAPKQIRQRGTPATVGTSQDADGDLEAIDRRSQTDRGELFRDAAIVQAWDQVENSHDVLVPWGGSLPTLPGSADYEDGSITAM
jgi:hypothetical protein